jgi:poly-gamma-glutamate capsule biosynthesis protein CapA/YwtB (metallophosphatase superfamily)
MMRKVIAVLLGGFVTMTPAASVTDPGVRDAAALDPRRPPAAELVLRVPDGFTVTTVGDLISSRPLRQEAARLPGFKAVLDRLKRGDVLFGNMESTIFDVRHFTGAPYSYEGDWTNASLPEVAEDLREMGFDLVSRANNHAMDWGVEGMRETGRWLDDAGIVHAGAGETRGLARAPQYYETPMARVALVSFASTFRPTTDALPQEGAVPARPGISALHVESIIEVPADAMKQLTTLECALHRRHCDDTPNDLDLFDKHFRRGPKFAYRYTVDPEDRAEILKAVREAKQHSDLVIVSIHTHECSVDCDDEGSPRPPGDFLAALAHDAVDAGADVFVATGNHNLGPIEIYDAPGRGKRPIFYGIGDFFWSDVQPLLPHDLYQANRGLLARVWDAPQKATPYDLTAPLNAGSFAHDFTFHGVIAHCRFEHGQLAAIELDPLDLGYGAPLTESGIPRLATDRKTVDAIKREILDMTRAYGLPALHLAREGGTIAIRP